HRATLSLHDALPIYKAADHGMLGSTDQIEILPLDLVHHSVHLIKAHHAGHHIAADHIGGNTVGKPTVNHKITGIRQHSGMQTGKDRKSTRLNSSHVS